MENYKDSISNIKNHEAKLKAEYILKSIEVIDQTSSFSKPASARHIDTLCYELEDTFRKWTIESEKK